MRHPYVVLLFFTLISCTSHVDTLYEINPEKFSEEQFTLSDIADDIKYIPLDNTFPIGGTYSVMIIKNGIYISAQNKGVLQFDRHGKYLSTIGRNGRGPGEYRNPMYFTVDENKKLIYIVDDFKIKVYTLEGVFLRDIPTKKYAFSNPFGIFMSGSFLFLPFYPEADLTYNWIILDTLGNLVSKKLRPYHHHPTQKVPIGSAYQFENKLYYGDFLNDTIFSISPDLKTQGAYLFSQGDYRWPKDGIAVNLIRETAWLEVFTMFESKYFIFMKYVYQHKESILLIDKNTKKTYQAYKPDEGRFLKYTAGIKNDLDGGLPVTLGSRQYFYFIENGSEYVAFLRSPFVLKNHVASEDFVNSTPKYPDKKNELEKLASSLHESDNPVLIMVKLKE